MTDVTITTVHTVKVPNPPQSPESNAYGAPKEQIIVLTPDQAHDLHKQLSVVLNK